MLLGAPAMAQQQVTIIEHQRVVVITSNQAYAPAFMAPSAGELGIRRYETHENHCPAGLQPVSMDGSFSCGTPNRYQTYQQAMKHPVQRKRHGKVRHYSARPNCPAGAKGCY